MAKVIVRNFAEHEFHLPGTGGTGVGAAPAGAVGMIKFPRLGTRVGADGVGIETPGEIEVDSSVIDRMKTNPVTASWLKNDNRGRPQLVVEAALSAPDSDKGAKK